MPQTFFPSSRELYPVVHDLTDAEYGQDPTISSICCDGGMMGSFSIYDLVRPLHTPRSLPLTPPTKQTSRPTHRPTRHGTKATRFSTGPPSSECQHGSQQIGFGSSNTLHTAATCSTIDTSGSFDDDFVLTRQVCRCSLSTIWECIHKGRGTRHCVKIVDKRRFSTKAEEEGVRNELKLLTSFQTPEVSRLVRMVQWTEERYKIFIVMDYVAGGNLAALARDEVLSEGQIRLLARSILLGLQELHELCIGHFHLQPSNILVKTNHHDVVICDFGCAMDAWDGSQSRRNRTEREKRRPRFGSLPYASPELCRERPEFGLSADVWSLGIILYELFAHELPFGECSRQEMKEKITNGRFDLTGPCWGGVSRSGKQFISSLLHPDHHLRMTVKEALSHPWILCPPPSALLPSDPEENDAGSVVSNEVHADDSTHQSSPKSSKMLSKTIKSKLRFIARGAKKILSKSLRVKDILQKRRNRR